MPTLAVPRTFWEKATILHAEYHRPSGKGFPSRISRHHYDIFMIVTSEGGKALTSDVELLERVVHHKEIFFKSSWANYRSARPGTMRMVPAPHQISNVKEDYALMRQMFFSDPPSFETILDQLKFLESTINR